MVPRTYLHEVLGILRASPLTQTHINVLNVDVRFEELEVGLFGEIFQDPVLGTVEKVPWVDTTGGRALCIHALKVGLDIAL